jgi:hypothetical protein
VKNFLYRTEHGFHTGLLVNHDNEHLNMDKHLEFITWKDNLPKSKLLSLLDAAVISCPKPFVNSIRQNMPIRNSCSPDISKGKDGVEPEECATLRLQALHLQKKGKGKMQSDKQSKGATSTQTPLPIGSESNR